MAKSRMMNLTRTFDRLTSNLKNLTQLQTQLESESKVRLDVSKKWPGEINDAKQNALDIYLRLNELETEIETSVSHHQEAHGGLQTSIITLNNIRTILGSKGDNLHILLAGDAQNLTPLIESAIGLPNVMSQVLDRMSPDSVKVLKKLIQELDG